MTVLAGHCSEHDEAVPYLPFVEILEGYVERISSPDVLRTLLGEEGPELARLLPKLNRILPDLPPPLELPPQRARRNLFNCFCDFVARVAREQATLLILEDLHWADDSTLALLGHLTQRLSRLPLLVAGTYRDAELNISDALAKMLENLLRGRLATALTLTGLRREEVADMLSSLSGQAPPAAIAAEFHREPEGNPFFIEELFRHLEEENRLYDSDGIFHTELRVAELEVPRSVRLVVGRRLARLSDRTRTTLGTAATIGRLFSFELLEASTMADASSLLESVEEAERAGLVFFSAESPTARFEFSHELVWQAVVGGLSAARRQWLHLEVAEAIERVYSHALEDHYGELAHHYGRSDNVAKAVEYLGRAGQQAIRRSAYAEAISSLSAAIDLLQMLPESL
jgi:predicted ATPase